MLTPTVTPPRGGIVKQDLVFGGRAEPASRWVATNDALLVKGYPRTALNAQILSQRGLDMTQILLTEVGFQARQRAKPG